MRFLEISDGLYCATRKVTNVYLITREDSSILIDTGEPSFAGPILKALEGFPPVGTILLTHAHYDHSGSAAELSRRLDAPALAHRMEVDLLETGAWRRSQTPSPSLFGYVLTHLVAKRFPDRVEPPDRLESIAEINDATLLDLKLIELPGHSEGQIGFGMKCADGSTAWIVGDVIMTSPGLREPILYEDRTVGLASIVRLAGDISPGDVGITLATSMDSF